MRTVLALTATACLTIAAPARAQLYRVEFVQAAPGRLLDLIDLYKARVPVYAAAGEARPLMTRHSQGDKWDLMILAPIGASLSEYYSPDRTARRERAAAASGASAEAFEQKLRGLIAWREEMTVRGPMPDVTQAAFDASGFAHLEIFIALPGMQDALYKEREMENAFARGIGRPVNLIFTREGGAAWDQFTIGLYKDMVHYATSAVVPADVEDRAAKAAGFESRAAIGPYLRSLIATHHDNLAGIVR